VPGKRNIFNKRFLKEELEELYLKYNNKEYIKYDPIKFVYRFKNQKEREVIALISASLSFGRVTQIFKAIEFFLTICNNEPLKFITTLSDEPDTRIKQFKYRFVDGNDLFYYLKSIQKILKDYGSLGAFAEANYKGDIYGFLQNFTQAFNCSGYLMPMGIESSPCKRLFMFLRWMVRKDHIDLGYWRFIDPSDLIIPLDTHIFQVSLARGLTSKKRASQGAAFEITQNLKKYSKEDPVKYDWALSHMGIIKNNFLSISKLSE